MMSTFARFLRNAALALLLFSPLALASTPAQANALEGVKSCFLAAEAAAQIADTVSDPKFLGCSSQLTSNPVLIALTVVMGALAANGNIHDEASCQALVYGSAANFIADALVAAGALSNADADSLKNAVASGSIELIQNMLNAIGIGQNIDCSCSIAGNAVEVTKLMVSLAEHGGNCAGMAAAMSTAIAEGVASGIYGAGEWVHSLGGTMPAACTTGSGGYIVEGDFSVGACKPGKFANTGVQDLYKSANAMSAVTLHGSYNYCPPQWEDECGFCDFSKKPPGYDPTPYDMQRFVNMAGGGMCYCPPPAKISFYANGVGKPGSPQNARCVCPDGLGYTAKGTCEACAQGTVLNAEGVCAGCPNGSSFNVNSNTCAPTCAPGQIIKDPKVAHSDPQKNCTTCPENSVPKYSSSTTSIASCEKCPAGTVANAGELYCGNPCGYGSEWTGNSCKPLCGPGEYVVYGEFKTSCHKCSKGTVFSYDTLKCEKCPGNSKWEDSPTGGMCSCPSGQAMTNGKCTACKGVITSDWSTGGTCLPCPAGSQWTEGKDGGYCYSERPARDCPAGQIPDKKSPYESCVACPKDHYAYAGMCIPTKSIRQMGGNLKAPKPGDVEKSLGNFPCPDGMRKAGGACTPDKPGPDTRTLPKEQGEREDCRKLGSNYITGKDGSCRKCPMGRIANPAGTSCVLGYSTAPKAPDKPNYDLPGILQGPGQPDPRSGGAPNNQRNAPTYTPPPSGGSKPF